MSYFPSSMLCVDSAEAREREGRERERDRDRDRDTDRQTDRARDRERERERERQTGRQTERQTDSQSQSHRETEREHSVLIANVQRNVISGGTVSNRVSSWLLTSCRQHKVINDVTTNGEGKETDRQRNRQTDRQAGR